MTPSDCEAQVPFLLVTLSQQPQNETGTNASQNLVKGFFFFLFFETKNSIYSLRWPSTHSNPLASVSQV